MLFKLIFSIAFSQHPIYHTAIFTRSTELPFQSDIKPSSDGYAFHTFGSSIIVNKLIVEKIQIYYKIRIYTETVGKLVKFQWKNMGTYEELKERYRLVNNIKQKTKFKSKKEVILFL